MFTYREFAKFDRNVFCQSSDYCLTLTQDPQFENRRGGKAQVFDLINKKANFRLHTFVTSSNVSIAIPN